MKIKKYEEAEEFVAAFDSFWLQFESENCVQRRIALADKSGTKYFSIEDNSHELFLTTCYTAGDQIVISRANEKLLKILVDYLTAKNLDVPGVFAPNPTSTDFVKLYTEVSKKKFKRVKQMGHYALTKLLDIDLVSGSVTQASVGDREILIQLFRAFQKEGNTQRPVNEVEVVDRALKNKSIYVLKSGQNQLLCMATLFFDRSPHSVYIDAVYTPFEQRGNGYASRLVYELSKQILAKQLVPRLSVDMENPVAIKVYEKIGFHQECQMDNFRAFE